jgi:hypothetical protein
MSQRFRFIDIVRPIMGLLPEVEQPLKKVMIPYKSLTPIYLTFSYSNSLTIN